VVVLRFGYGRHHVTTDPRTRPVRIAKRKFTTVAIDEKDVVHPPGVEPGPIAWKAIILPLDQECLMKELPFEMLIYLTV
jgi:hypothetical protein